MTSAIDADIHTQNENFCNDICPSDIYSKDKEQCKQLCKKQIQKTIDEYNKKYNLSNEEIKNILSNKKTLFQTLHGFNDKEAKIYNEILNKNDNQLLLDFLLNVATRQYHEKCEGKDKYNINCRTIITNEFVNENLKNLILRLNQSGGKPKPKPKPKSKTKKKKNYKKKTINKRKTRNKRKGNKRRKTYKKKK
jgi:hypothetical protein